METTAYRRVANFLLAYNTSVPIRTIVVQTGISGGEVRRVLSFFQKQGLVIIDTVTNKVRIEKHTPNEKVKDRFKEVLEHHA